MEITKEMIIADLNNEIQSIKDWKGFSPKIQMEEKSALVDLMTFGKGSNGVTAVTSPDTNTVIFYLTEIIALFATGFGKFMLNDSVLAKITRFVLRITKEEFYHKVIHNMVVHEHRHCQQIEWLKSRNLCEKVFSAEDKGLYGLGAMERDAYRYQNKEQHVPFEKVFKKFLKEESIAA